MGLPDPAASAGVQQFEQELAIPPSHEFEVFHPGRPLEDEDAAPPPQEYAVFGDDGEQQQAQARQSGGASGEPLDYRVVSQPPDGFLSLRQRLGRLNRGQPHPNAEAVRRTTSKVERPGGHVVPPRRRWWG